MQRLATHAGLLWGSDMDSMDTKDRAAKTQLPAGATDTPRSLRGLVGLVLMLYVEMVNVVPRWPRCSGNVNSLEG